MFRAKNISKSFGNIQVLNGINLELEAGKVLAIIGENGAGKSTLMKVLSGIYTDYEGEISIDNQVVKFNNPKEAQQNGIAIIHQELNLIQDLSITENIFLGSEIANKFGLLDKAMMVEKTKNLLTKLKLNLNPNTPIKDLKVGQQQLVEIAKALLVDAKVIIMDEPTSAISGAEVETLFGLILELKKERKSIIYISHKLDELYQIADNYTILRDGNLVDSGEMKNISRHEIVTKMVGRDLRITSNDLRFTIEKHQTILLEIKNSSPITYHLSLKKGEILGIFGLMGAGRTELLESLFGLSPLNGEIYIEGKKVNINSPIDAIKNGLALVSEDRKRDGIIPELSVKKNISITTLMNLLKSGVLNNQKEENLSKEYIEKLQIKTTSAEQAIQNLSGGNQQKVILSKWLATNPKVLLLDEPTRGIDVNAKAEIYKIITELAQNGLGIIMVSSELPEILAISHRVIVLCDGKITGDFPIEKATEEILLNAAIS